jgi:ethanolamine utilization protein EutJ
MTTPGLDLHKLVNQPDSWNFSDARQLYAGVDLGTYKAITIIIDETGKPRAARMRRAEVVRSGLIVDYAGAQNIVREMIQEMRDASHLPIEKGATSYPPQTEYANINATRYILEGMGLEVLNVLDEPTAANQILKLENGAIVDVGGEEAEEIKTDRQKNREILPIVRPVIEKIASIVEACLQQFNDLTGVCLVGGTCELEGFTEIVQKTLRIRTFRPEYPQFTTPLGIALSCLDAN